MKAVKIVFAILICVFLASCSLIYASPGSNIVSSVLGGADWPSDIPAPAFIGKYLGKYLDMGSDPTNPNVVVIAFFDLSHNEVVKYAKALIVRGFGVTGVVVYYNEDDYVRAAGLSFRNANYYEIKKGDLEMTLGSGGGITEIRFDGLTKSQISALNVEFWTDEWDELDSVRSVKKDVAKDISEYFGKNPGTEGRDNDGLWSEYFPVPAFMSNASMMEYDIGKPYIDRMTVGGDIEQGYSIVFTDTSIPEISSYISLLKNMGYKIYKVNSYDYYPDAKQGGYYAIENVREELFAYQTMTDLPAEVWCIRVDNGDVSLYIDLGNPYWTDKKGEGFGNMGYHSEEYAKFTFRIYGLSGRELDRLLENAGKRWSSLRFDALINYALSNDIIDFSEHYRLGQLVSDGDMDSLLADELVSRLMTDPDCLAYIEDYVKRRSYTPYEDVEPFETPEMAEPENINNTLYTFEEIDFLLLHAWISDRITSNEYLDLMFILNNLKNADKVMESDCMKKVLADDEFWDYIMRVQEYDTWSHITIERGGR